MHAVMGAGRLIGGRYRLREPLGRGAMGIVWRGRDEVLARNVAVKEVQVTGHATPAEAEVIYQRTLREARTAARLSHPSVVKVFDVVEEAGSPWIVMELVEARSLDRVIIEDGPLPPGQAADLGASLIGALAAAHTSGVLHRDVKPSNVLVTADGRVVLTDFGIATFADALGLTQAGMVVGTPGFTAPERIRGEIATPAADLWSLGATLYAAVEGRGPFERAGGSSVISTGVANEDAPRAPSAGPLRPVIEALLSRDPGTRPDAPTAGRLLAEAATAARTGPRLPRDSWLTADADRANGQSADRTRQIRGRDSGFPYQPDGWALQMPAPLAAQSPADGAAGSGERAVALAGAAVAEVSPAGLAAAGVTLAGAAVAGAAPAGAAVAEVSPAGATATGAAVARAAVAGAAVAGAAVAEVAAAEVGPTLAGKSFAGGATAAAAEDSGPASSDDPDTGPVFWGRAQTTYANGHQADRPSRTAGAGNGPGGSGPGGSGPGRTRAAAQPAGRSSGRRRLMMAGAGVAALIVAAIAAANIFQQSGPSALGTLPGTSAAGNSAPGQPGSQPSGGASGSHGSPTTPGSPKTGPSGTPAASAPSGSASSSPGSTGTPAPSPGTGNQSTGPTLPTGYRWHDFTALQMGAVAGFKIGMPDLWTQSVSAPVAHLNQSARGFHLAVNLSYWTYAKPLSEAQYLQARAASAYKYHGYKELLLAATNFQSLGGFRSATAAELEYSWNSGSLGYNETELIILVTLNTSAGPQPYEFELSAPTLTFGSARSVLTTAMPTFRPLPG